VLRVNPAEGSFTLTLPVGTAASQIHPFLHRQIPWMRRCLAELPPVRPFLPGDSVPYLGHAHLIRHRGTRRGTTERQGGEILVSGEPAFLGRRIEAYLKAEARRLLTEKSLAMAARLKVKVTGISIRDTRSRWGSASGRGRLSFSWRLILAPESVLDYVVAHEVAHLREMNHSDQFWAVVAQLVPDPVEARQWLKRHGPELLRWGG
jgi:predicted metal-dependent hydrolase